MPGYDDLAGFIPGIQDYGLGVAAGIGGRVGFAGVSEGGQALGAGTVIVLNNQNDVRQNLNIGPAVEQLLDLFEDGYGNLDRQQNVQSVVYCEMDITAGTASAQTDDVTGIAGAVTVASNEVLGDVWLDRHYAIEITDAGAGGEISDGDCQYRICRNYDVVDPAHRVWEGPYMVVEDAVPGTWTLYLEQPGTGPAVVFTVAVGIDFVLGDIFETVWECAIPTVALAVAAVNTLARWRDALGNGIGGQSDITVIGNDREWASANWDDLHAVATTEWNDNYHPVQLWASVYECGKTGVPLEYDIDDWVLELQVASTLYRGVTLPGNADLNGALVLSAVYLLRGTTVGMPSGVEGSIVRHQCGAQIGQYIRGRWHWDIGWPERYEYRSASAVYPHNSDVDNMINDGVNRLEYRTSLINLARLLIAWPRPGYIQTIVTDSTWAMSDNLSDYFKAPYFRLVGAIQVVARIWFSRRCREPGISSNDAAQLEAEANALLLRPRTVDAAIPGDSIVKPFNQAQMNIWAEPNVLITETLDYSLLIVPTGTKYQLAGFSQLRRSL